MDKLLTTTDFAQAIGASESSLRRWTNSGAIRTSRTMGGHRRIPLSEAIRFIRESGATIVRPELLGLATAAPAVSRAAGGLVTSEEALYQALADGDAAAVTGQLAGLYLGGMALAEIMDNALAGAMHRLGELWRHDQRGILVEHRATSICLQAVARLRQMLPAPEPAAPIAVGGAGPGDPYVLPSLIVATVLCDSGYRDVNLGPETPIDVLAAAAEEQHAALVWLSVSVSGKLAELRRDVDRLIQRLRPLGASLVLGGRHAGELGVRRDPHVHVLQTMSELVAFTRGAKPAANR